MSEPGQIHIRELTVQENHAGRGHCRSGPLRLGIRDRAGEGDERSTGGKGQGGRDRTTPTTRLEDDLTHAQNRIDGLTQVVRAYEQIGADGVNPQWVQTLPLAGNAVGHHGGVYGHGQGTYGGDQGRLTGAGWADDMYRSLPRDRSESPTQSVLDWDARSDDSIVS
jgi:hypothetical protein